MHTMTAPWKMAVSLPFTWVPSPRLSTTDRAVALPLLVSAFFGVAFRQRDDVANHFMIAKLHAFDHHAIAHIQTRN